MDVGVRDLKQRLSSYLDRAARGERITVTERGRPKAVLGPLPGGANLERGITEGWITPPDDDDEMPPSPRRYPATTSVQEMIDEDRDET